MRRASRTLAELRIRQHPGKTFVGRISRGFDFLGYRFSSAGLVGVALQAVERCAERMTPLYEQGADDVRIGDYVRRWLVWVRSGLRSFPTFNLSPYAAAEKLPLQVPAVLSRGAGGLRVRVPPSR